MKGIILYIFWMYSPTKKATSIQNVCMYVIVIYAFHDAILYTVLMTKGYGIFGIIKSLCSS